MVYVLCYNMKNGFSKQKSKIFIILIALIFVISCFTNTTKHDIVFADTQSNIDKLNSMSIDEIASQEKYNSCDYDIVTPNLDQGSTDICWAYATTGASETSVLKDKLDNNTKDTLRFSPTQIAYKVSFILSKSDIL